MTERVLADFGMPDALEQAWRGLVARPELQLRELAQTLHQSVEDTRCALEDLVRLDLAILADTPTVFLAVDPSIALRGLINRQRRDLADRALRLNEIESKVAALSEQYAVGRTALMRDTTLEVVLTIDEVRRQIHRRTSLAETSIRNMLNQPSADGAKHSRDFNIASYERGVRHRTLVATNRLDNGGIYQALSEMRAHDDEVRSMPGIPTTLIVWDDFSAVLPLDQADLGRGAMFVHDPTLINILTRFFDHFWVEATPVFAAIDSSSGPTGRQATILSLIAAGSTDTAIARSLDVTARTIRREVAELRALAGVSTRAEIIAAAVRRGWL